MCAAVVTRMMMCNLELFLSSRATLLSELPLYAMPASLTAPKLLSKISWGLDGRPVESTQQHDEAARQLDYLKGSTSHWNQTDARLTQEVNGVSVLQARDRNLCAPIIAVQACCETEREDITEFLHQAEDARRKFSPSFVDFTHDEEIRLRGVQLPEAVTARQGVRAYDEASSGRTLC